MSSDSANPETEQGAPSLTELTITPASVTTVSFPITERMAQLIEEAGAGLFYDVSHEHRAEWLLCCALADRIAATDSVGIAMELNHLGWQIHAGSELDSLLATGFIGQGEPLSVRLQNNAILWVPPSLLFGLTGRGI